MAILNIHTVNRFGKFVLQVIYILSIQQHGTGFEISVKILEALIIRGWIYKDKTVITIPIGYSKVGKRDKLFNVQLSDHYLKIWKCLRHYHIPKTQGIGKGKYK